MLFLTFILASFIDFVGTVLHMGTRVVMGETTYIYSFIDPLFEAENKV